MKKQSFYNIILIPITVAFLAGSVISVGADEEPGKWDKAGKEIKEASDAVVEATKDTSKQAWDTTKEESQELYEKTREGTKEAWDKTKETSEETWEKVKEGSGEAWDKTKETSQEVYEKTRDTIHEATAPEPAKETPPVEAKPAE